MHVLRTLPLRLPARKIERDVAHYTHDGDTAVEKVVRLGAIDPWIICGDNEGRSGRRARLGMGGLQRWR